MFISATTIAHAKQLGVEYKFPSRSGKRGQFPFMFPELGLLGQKEDHLMFENYREPHFGIYEPLPARDHLRLQGYWQSELYFKEYRKEIIKVFNIPIPRINSNVVSLHIRRGDSLKFIDKLPQPTDKYLNGALEHFPNYQVLIFSDDLAWCREKFKGERFSFFEGVDPKFTMSMMAACENNIIVNSTFSWWGAYLNPNPNKIVISPSSNSWFGDSWKHKLSAQDIPCKDWIQIDY